MFSSLHLRLLGSYFSIFLLFRFLCPRLYTCLPAFFLPAPVLCRIKMLMVMMMLMMMMINMVVIIIIITMVIMVATPILILQYYVALKLITVSQYLPLELRVLSRKLHLLDNFAKRNVLLSFTCFCETLLALRKNRENHRIAETLDHKAQHAGGNKINI